MWEDDLLNYCAQLVKHYTDVLLLIHSFIFALQPYLMWSNMTGNITVDELLIKFTEQKTFTLGCGIFLENHKTYIKYIIIKYKI